MNGGHELTYKVEVWPGFFNHNDHWVDNFELDLNYKPQSSLRSGG